MRVEIINEQSLLLHLDKELDQHCPLQLAQLRGDLLTNFPEMIIDAVPAYTTILLYVKDIVSMEREISQFLNTYQLNNKKETSTEIITIPVYYGEEVALDADVLMKHCQLNFDECIQLHAQQVYDVYAVGFAPGFAYLGNIDEQLRIPRLSTPRKHVPAGSVAIAENQTAVYPQVSPGGWHIIGRTAMPLLQLDQDQKSIFSVGSKVQFEAIDKDTFLAQGGDLT